MTDETKKPDEIDQLALDAHPEEGQGNAAGGASSDAQPQDSASAPAATDGDAGEQGNVSETQPSSPLSSSPSLTQTQSDESQTELPSSASSDGSLPSDSSAATGSGSGDAGNAAGAATDGAQQAGDAPAGGGEPLPLADGGVAAPGDDSGNALAAGAPSADGTGSETETNEHPLKTRARALRLKFEAEEAVVMEHIVDLLRDIEETL
ncbi:hypothetical protein A9R05_06815 [Burkholderia sp. KK1]|nr:hypothetical protein A9R05_06815 [Burkholderia sp. KK1]